MARVPKWVYRLPWNLIHDAADEFGLEPELIGAVVQTESAGNPYAVRYEPVYRWTFEIQTLAQIVHCTTQTMEVMQKTSYGLMQVMGGVFYDLGGHKNENHLWATSMIDPWIGIQYGCKHLRKKYRKYGPDPSAIYASYNAGSVIKTDGGFYVNEKAVDRFMNFYRDLTDDYRTV